MLMQGGSVITQKLFRGDSGTFSGTLATIGSTGNYFVRFFLGSYDRTGGTVLGARLIVNGFSFSAPPSVDSWIITAGPSTPSCNTVCTSAGKTCDAALIRSATLESDCATQLAVLGLSSNKCIRCSPSDSTNDYCFPGRAGGNMVYYHTSFAVGGFNCATVPDSRTNPSICPCV